MDSAQQDQIPVIVDLRSDRLSQISVQAKDSAFMSQTAFSEACRYWMGRSREAGCVGMHWRLCGELENQYLTVSRSLQTQFSESCSWSLDDEVQTNAVTNDNEDDEVTIHHHSGTGPSVEYSILFSHTYCVPVLYFSLKELPSSSVWGIDAIHELLVPEHMRTGLQQVGVMGGISMSNHPATDVPAYFIHPCNTSEAMQNIIDGRNVSPPEYLQIWIGLIGACIGLYLPSQLIASKLQEK